MLLGIKIQLCTLPNGMIGDFYGPVFCRHNDNYCLNGSELNKRITDIQNNKFNPIFKIYGDSAYHNDTAIKRRHESPLTPEQLRENNAYNSARQSIEHINNDIKSKFAFLDYSRGLKVRQMDFAYIVFTALLLTNCYKCLNGCQTLETFQIMPPTLHDYLHNF